MQSGFLLPDTDDEDSAPFWAGAARGELLVQACGACGTRRIPPRPMCHVCRSTQVRWDRMSGQGTIWSYVVAHPPLLPAFQAVAPYPVVTVTLDEAPALRLVGNLLARPDGPINEVDPKTIAIGQRVRVVFQQLDDVWIPRWMRV